MRGDVVLGTSANRKFLPLAFPIQYSPLLRVKTRADQDAIHFLQSLLHGTCSCFANFGDIRIQITS